MDLNEILVRAYEIGLELLKKQKISFSADELSDILSSYYLSPIPFKGYGCDSLEALLENSDLFERCPLSNEFRCVRKENYKFRFGLPPRKGCCAVDPNSEDEELRKTDEEENSEELEKKRIEEQKKIPRFPKDKMEAEVEVKSGEKEEEASVSATESLDSDEEIRSMQIAMRESRKRQRVSDPGPPRFSLDSHQKTLSSDLQESDRSLSPPSKKKKILTELQEFTMKWKKEKRLKRREKRKALKNWKNAMERKEKSAEPSVSSDAPSSGARSIEAPMVSEIVGRIFYCLIQLGEEPVKLRSLYPLFREVYQETLHKALKKVFSGKIFEELAKVEQNKFVMEKDARGSWIFLKTKENEIEAKEHDPHIVNSASSALLLSVPASSDVPPVPSFDSMLSVLIERISCCLLQFKENEVKLSRLFPVFERLFCEKINDALRKIFPHGKSFAKLSKIGQNKFFLKKGKGDWIFHKNVENKTETGSNEREKQTTKHVPAVPTPSFPVPPPTLLPILAAMNCPFVPRPPIIPRPTDPSPPLYYMNDRRLTDFAYRIRHVLINMGGRGILPHVEEAYYRTFGSHLQSDFFCLVPYNTPPHILTEVSQGTILVDMTREGWIHFRLHNFFGYALATTSSNLP